MPEVEANGVRLYHEEQGEGDPIACIHGTGSSALVWGDAIGELARLGRVVAYDRRGSTRSERPEPYERTSVTEHADDAAALLEALDAMPAVVIGRSYGGAVAIDLALRYPERVRALVLLEPADIEVSAAVGEWLDALAERVRRVAEEQGMDRVAEEFLSEVLEEGAWEALPEPVRQMFSDNSPAILAETLGERFRPDLAALAAIEVPVLLVAGRDSAPEFREVTEALAEALPDARTELVGGGHLINPADPAVLEFLGQVLDGR